MDTLGFFHEVFNTPLRVRPPVEERRIPENYRTTYAGAGMLPDEVKVWCVQEGEGDGGGQGGALACFWGFEDSPDAEILCSGYDTEKEYGAVAVGRLEDLLFWGYDAPPRRMTEEGRRFFLNALCFLARKEGAERAAGGGPEGGTE